MACAVAIMLGVVSSVVRRMITSAALQRLDAHQNGTRTLLSTMKATLKPLTDLESLGARWRRLEERVPNASFFQSWTWVGSWLQALPNTGCVRVLTIEN